MKVHICDHLWTLGGSVLPNLYELALEVFYPLHQGLYFWFEKNSLEYTLHNVEVCLLDL